MYGEPGWLDRLSPDQHRFQCSCAHCTYRRRRARNDNQHPFPGVGIVPIGPIVAPGRIRRPPKKPFNYCADKNAVGFVKSHLADAQALANKLGVPPQFVLAVSADESGYGGAPAALGANNFFGIHAGTYATAAGSTGPWSANPVLAAWAQGTDGFLGSGEAFVSIANSDNASGVKDPRAFFTDIHAQFGVGTPNYVSDMLSILKAVTARLRCP